MMLRVVCIVTIKLCVGEIDDKQSNSFSKDLTMKHSYNIIIFK